MLRIPGRFLRPVTSTLYVLILLTAMFLPARARATEYKLYASNMYAPAYNNGWDYETRAVGDPNGGNCTIGNGGNSAQQLYAQAATRDSSIIVLDFDTFTLPAGESIQKVELDVSAAVSNTNSPQTTIRLGAIGSAVGGGTVSFTITSTTCDWLFTALNGYVGNGWDITSRLPSLTAAAVNGVAAYFHRYQGSTGTQNIIASGFRMTVTTSNTITASAGPNGTISPAGSISVSNGASQAFTFSPATCYHVADVVVDGVSQGPLANYTFVGVTANHTISVSFALNGPYAITLTSTPAAGGAIIGSTSVACGSSATYSITTNSCYTLTSVTVDGVSQPGPPTSVTLTNVQAPHTIAASYTLTGPYTITASAGTGGSISPSGATSVACGGSQGYSVTASTCNHILDVLIDGVSQGPITTYTFSNVTAGHAISATFAANTPYSITPTAGANGSISPSTAQSIPCGTNKTFTITPSPCFTIADVVIDNVSVGPVTTYTFSNVTANHTISANFTSNGSYSIIATASANGTISPPGTANVGCGSSQTYTIQPNNCYQVADVLVDGVSVGALTAYTFTTVAANHTISATFSPAGPFTISASAGGNGSISSPGNSSLNCGSSKTYAISANACFSIGNVTVDGNSVGQVSSYTFTNVTTNHTISATFIASPTYAIAASSGANGTLTPSGIVNVPCGGSQAFTITANACFHRLDVVVDGISLGPIATYTFSNVGGTHSIAATFSADSSVATALLFTTQPTTNTGAGIAFAPAIRVSVLDACGHLATNATTPVCLVFDTNPTNASLSGTLCRPPVGGIATFDDVAVSRTGTGYRLTATSGSLPQVQSSNFDICSGPPTSIQFAQQPTNAAGCTSIAPGVDVVLRDQNGDVATCATGSVGVQLANNAGGANLGGTILSTVTAGHALFSNLSLDRPGTGYTLRASFVSLTPAVSGPFDVTNGLPAKLAFQIQPSAVDTAGGAIVLSSCRVGVYDACGNLVTTATNPITLVRGAIPDTVILSGALTRNAVDGSATFANILLNRWGTGYTLIATSPGLVSATSDTFGVRRGVGVEPSQGARSAVLLMQSVPNPVGGSSTLIDFVLPRAMHAQLRIYDVAGHLVRTLLDGNASAGRSSLKWDLSTRAGVHVTPGVYFYALDADRVHLRRWLVVIE